MKSYTMKRNWKYRNATKIITTKMGFDWNLKKKSNIRTSSYRHRLTFVDDFSCSMSHCSAKYTQNQVFFPFEISVFGCVQFLSTPSTFNCCCCIVKWFDFRSFSMKRSKVTKCVHKQSIFFSFFYYIFINFRGLLKN